MQQSKDSSQDGIADKVFVAVGVFVIQVSAKLSSIQCV